MDNQVPAQSSIYWECFPSPPPFRAIPEWGCHAHLNIFFLAGRLQVTSAYCADSRASWTLVFFSTSITEELPERSEVQVKREKTTSSRGHE